MNVLSLFDGMSCGQLALERIGVKVDNYYASEIDKYAMQVTMSNFPNTIQLGSVVNVDGTLLPKIDLMMGGSPCQSFSFAGHRKGMSTKDEQEILTLEYYLQLKEEGYEFEGQSYLFWEYMRLLREVKPTYFLLENVEMGEKWEKVLSKAIGVNGIHINSALVSAQNRKRIYWFGQIRERIFFNDNFCYICSNETKNRRIQGESQDKRIAEILGETQGGQVNVQDLQSGILEDKSKRDNKDLFGGVSVITKNSERQESESRKKESNTQDLFREKQGEVVAIPKGLQKDTKGERNCEKSGGKSNEENSENYENSSTQRVNWSKEEANKRRIDYHTKYGKEMCCVQCGKKLDYRSYSSIIERGDKSNYKSPSALSEVQFNEARQNNGRVFDILEIGIKGIDSLFGETIINIPQPKNKSILLKDILESEFDEKYFLSEKMHNYILKENNKPVNRLRLTSPDQKKCGSVLANEYKQGTDSNFIVHNTQRRDPNRPSVAKNKNAGGSGPLSRTDGKTYALDTGNTNAIEQLSQTERLLERTGVDISDVTEPTILDVYNRKLKEDGKCVILTDPCHNNIRLVEPREVKQLSTNNKSNGGTQPYQQDRIYDVDGISPALSAGKSDLMITSGTWRTHKDGQGFREVHSEKGATIPARAREDGSGQNVVMVDDSVNKPRIRRLTPIECERLQTVPDNYTSAVSDTQRYKMLGNGWTIDVIAHIFSYLPPDLMKQD